MTTTQHRLLEAYRATGRIAFYHPHKQTISLNGHRALPVSKALAQVKETLNREGK